MLVVPFSEHRPRCAEPWRTEAYDRFWLSRLRYGKDRDEYNVPYTHTAHKQYMKATINTKKSMHSPGVQIGNILTSRSMAALDRQNLRQFYPEWKREEFLQNEGQSKSETSTFEDAMMQMAIATNKLVSHTICDWKHQCALHGTPCNKDTFQEYANKQTMDSILTRQILERMYVFSCSFPQIFNPSNPMNGFPAQLETRIEAEINQLLPQDLSRPQAIVAPMNLGSERETEEPMTDPFPPPPPPPLDVCLPSPSPNTPSNTELVHETPKRPLTPIPFDEHNPLKRVCRERRCSVSSSDVHVAFRETTDKDE